jgi:hypothetical protein
VLSVFRGYRGLSECKVSTVRKALRAHRGRLAHRVKLVFKVYRELKVCRVCKAPKALRAELVRKEIRAQQGHKALQGFKA